MPILRVLLVTPLVITLLGLGTASLPSESHLTPAASYLPRLVVQGGAPTAALLVRTSASAPHDIYRSTGPGIRYPDRFRAGSITKTFVATVVLQLAREGVLRLSDPVDRFLPGLIRGHGNDGRRITLRALLSHTSGLYDYRRRVRASGLRHRRGPHGDGPPPHGKTRRIHLLQHRLRRPRPGRSACHRPWLRDRDPTPHHPPPPPHRHLTPRRPHRPARPARPRLLPGSRGRRPARRHRPRPAHRGRGR